MKSKTFVEKAIDIANNYNTLYVMGCIGAPLVGGNVNRYCTNNPYNTNATRTKMIKNVADKNPPYFGFDCVCLIKSILWGWNGDGSKTYGGATYASNGVPDISADAMIKVCSEVSTNFSNIVVGEAVWMSGHIGIYIGNGLAVECTPAWNNKVQITAVKNIGNKNGYNSRKWTSHGKLPYVDYSDNTTVTTPTNTTTKHLTNGNTSFIHNNIDYSLVFNPTYYAEKYSDLKSAFGTDENKLFEHFIMFGMKECRRGSENFNVHTYMNSYVDLQKAFGNNITEYYKHYIMFGYAEKRKAV